MLNTQCDSSLIVMNCTFSGNSAVWGGGMWNTRSSSPTVTNCVLWGDNLDEISGNGSPTVTYSNVQGGFPGTGNIDADPLFVDPANGDFRLSPGSPCIDAGDNSIFPLGGCGDCDQANPDGPGCSDPDCEQEVCFDDPLCCEGAWTQTCANLASFVCNCPLVEITIDLDGNPRFVDDPDTVDTGYGDPPIVDMGAYEFQIPCPWDLNGNGSVDVVDLLQLIASWGPCEACPADFNDDGLVNVVDLLALIANFGPCPGVPCVWDVTGDGIVDQSDLHQVQENFGPCDGCAEDVNDDGMVNGQDAAAVATHFGPCP
jgi:hypothetical protein